MTDLRPFRALRYDPRRVDLSRVVVPPYDVITPEERVRYYARDPHSAIRLELTERVEDEAGTDYREVSERLRAWQREGVLLRDPEPGFYALRQRFRTAEGLEHERVGLFGALRLEPYERRVVLPHERTMSGPKRDRLKQLRAARTNLSSVFLLYEDREDALGPVVRSAFRGEPLGRAVDEAGTEHVLARLDAPEATRAVREFLADRQVVIADGHHRYETALAYREECRSERARRGGDAEGERPEDFLLVYLANAFAPGTLLLPIHRVVRKGPAPSEHLWRERLAGWEERRVPVAEPAEIPEVLARELAPLADRHAFAADDGSGLLRVFSRPADGDLTIRVLEEEVVGGVFGIDREAIREGALAFPKDARLAAEQVRSGQGSVALYVNPLTPDDVFRVTRAGEVLPQKSTFFVPKLPSGLLFRPLDEP